PGSVLRVFPLRTLYCLLARRAPGPDPEDRGYVASELRSGEGARFFPLRTLGSLLAHWPAGPPAPIQRIEDT
ncbi:hypothetical protein QEH52_15390, partial [Coraliomargarita sp. SDUM461003]